MRPTHELFHHTADLGIRVIASSPEDVVPEAYLGLCEAIGDLFPVVETSQPETISIREGSDRAALLRSLLGELLFRFVTRSELVTTLNVEEFTEELLQIECTFSPLDFTRSSLLREVKAVTYHGLCFDIEPGLCRFECILDI